MHLCIRLSKPSSAQGHVDIRTDLNGSDGNHHLASPEGGCHPTPLLYEKRREVYEKRRRSLREAKKKSTRSEEEVYEKRRRSLREAEQ
eukprot:gene15869-biopygen729